MVTSSDLLSMQRVDTFNSQVVVPDLIMQEKSENCMHFPTRRA